MRPRPAGAVGRVARSSPGTPEDRGIIPAGGVATPTTANPQAGLFAIGTAAQLYLELRGRPGADPRGLVAAIAGLREPRTTMGAVNLVVGFRPELYRAVRPRGIPAGLRGFDRPVRGADGFSMPATQEDAFLWFSGAATDVVFDEARAALAPLDGTATVATETTGWAYRQDRDLTGFIDGSENPTLPDAPRVALIPSGRPGAGGSVLLLQKWRHRAAEWERLSVRQQERIMGRTKPESIELDPKPADSHVARTDQDAFGHIFRRNAPYGDVTDHGTMFVGFCASQAPLARMLASMAGSDGAPRDALTRFSEPLTGAYYFVPSADELRRWTPAAAP